MIHCKQKYKGGCVCGLPMTCIKGRWVCTSKLKIISSNNSRVAIK